MVFPCKICKPSWIGYCWLSTFKHGRITIKNAHAFLIITANSLMPSHPGPQWKMYGGLIQIPCQESYSSKIRIEHWYIQFSLFYCWWYTLWFCWPWGIPVEKHVNDKNIESNHQMPDIVEKHISGTEITDCSHIAEIETQAFCFQLHMQTYWLSV